MGGAQMTAVEKSEASGCKTLASTGAEDGGRADAYELVESLAPALSVVFFVTVDRWLVCASAGTARAP